MNENNIWDNIQNLLDNYTVVKIKMLQVLKGRNYLGSDEFTEAENQQILQLKILETNYEAEILKVLFESNKERVEKLLTTK